jgi:hypothetical protein
LYSDPQGVQDLSCKQPFWGGAGFWIFSVILFLSITGIPNIDPSLDKKNFDSPKVQSGSVRVAQIGKFGGHKEVA